MCVLAFAWTSDLISSESNLTETCEYDKQFKVTFCEERKQPFIKMTNTHLTTQEHAEKQHEADKTATQDLHNQKLPLYALIKIEHLLKNESA